MYYIKCREFVKNLKLNSAKEWFEYHKNNKPEIPYHPERHFKNNGWINWSDWLGKENDQRKYSVNDDYFKKNSRNMFYILGFWFADGHINKNRFFISQHKDDIDLLNKISIEMNSDFPLIKCQDNFQISITSKELVSDIKKFGGIQNKTKTINFPNIPEDFLLDFIRGFFDGDGCITYQKNEKCYVSSIICASENFIKTLYNKLIEIIPNFNAKLKYYDYWHIIMGVNDTRRFRDFIYSDLKEDSLLLKRKYNKFILAGNIKVASFDKEFLSFKEAGIFMRNNNITKYRQWRKFKKARRIENIPASPDSVYEEYTTWDKFINQ